MIDVQLSSSGNYWQAWWIDPHTNKRKKKSLGPKSKWSKRQARARCCELVVELTKAPRGAVSLDGELKLSTWCERVILQQARLSAGTLHLYDHTMRLLLTHWPDDPPIHSITLAGAADWRSALAAGNLRRQNEKGTFVGPVPSETTVCKHVRTAKVIFDVAVTEEAIARNPFAKLRGRAPKVKKNWATITHGDLAHIVEACPNWDWKCLFALCRLAGLRRGEALILTWDRVDFARNRMRVLSPKTERHAGHAERIVPIEPARCPSGLAKLLLEAFEAAPPGAKLVCGDSICYHSINQQARKIIKQAGVPAYRKQFHTLRKNCATEWAQQYPMPVLADWFGHDITVAAEFYQKVPDELYLRNTEAVGPLGDDELNLLEQRLTMGEAPTHAEALRLIATLRAMQTKEVDA